MKLATEQCENFKEENSKSSKVTEYWTIPDIWMWPPKGGN